MSRDHRTALFWGMKHHQIRKANNDRNSCGVDLCTWGWGFWSQRSKGAQLGVPDVPDFLTKKMMSLYFVFISSAQHRGPRIIVLFPDHIRWSVNGPFGKCCWSMSKRVWSHYFRFIPQGSQGIRTDQVLQLSAALRWGAKGSEKRPTVTQEELQKHSSEEVGRERCSCSCSHSATAQGLGNVLAPLFTDMYTVYCSILYICK